MLLIVNDQQPYKTVKDFVDDARKRPNEIVFSSSGLYGALHLPAAQFMKAAGIEMKHLPTNGGGPASTAPARQQLAGDGLRGRPGQYTIEGWQSTSAGVLSAKRAASLPDVPTLKELGYDVEFSPWVGLFTPRGTPDAVIDKLRDETKKAVATEQFAKAIENIGDVVAYLDQPDFAKFWDADAKRVEDAVHSIGKI